MTKRKKKVGKSGKPKRSNSPKKVHSPVLVWINAHRTQITIGIFVLAGLLRLGYVVEVLNGPLGSISTWENSDANFFDQWSKNIRDGDLLGKEPFHPFHDWHLSSAQYFFDKNNMEVPADQVDSRARALWTNWYGGNQFHQEPLYPYLNAIWYSISGGKLGLVLIFQVLMSLVSLLLIMRITAGYFGNVASLVAGLLFALYGPAIFYDGILLRASLITTATLGVVYFYERSKSGTNKDLVLFGLVAGLAYMLKSTLLLLFLALLAYRFFDKRELPVWAKGTAISFGIFLLTLSPMIIRNATVGAPLMSSSSVGAVTYINSNFEEYNPASGFVVNHTYTTNILEQTEGKLLSTIGKSISSFSSFGKFIGLQFKKAGLVFSNHEIPNNFNFYLYKKYSFFLKLGVISYAMILGFGLVGLWLMVRRKKFNALMISLLIQVALLVGFYVISRFKVPLGACLIPFAGYAIAEVLANWHGKKTTAYTIGGAGLLLAIVFSIMPPNPKTKLRRTDPSLLFSHYYVPKLNALQPNEYASSVDIMQEILDKGPDHIVNYDGAELNSNEKNLAGFYAAIYNDLANIHKDLKQPAKRKEANQMSRKLNNAINN